MVQSSFAVESDWAYQMGTQKVEEACRSWVPRVIGFRRGTLLQDRSGCDFIIDTPSASISVDAKFRRRDYRPLEDDLCLEVWSDVDRQKVGWSRDRVKKTDLVCWVWADTGRVQVVPFGPLCELMVAMWKHWCHNYRMVDQVSERGGYYWSSQCVFIPLAIIKREIAPYLKFRQGIDLTHCIPADMKFCRLPNCPQTAMYPCRPEKPLWCYRHWEESKLPKGLTMVSTQAEEMLPPLRFGQVRAGKTPPILQVVDGRQEKLF